MDLVRSIVFKYIRFDQPQFDDVYQAGLIGLLKSIRKWDPDRNIKISTFAYNPIRFAVLNQIRSHNTIKVSVFKSCGYFDEIAKMKEWGGDLSKWEFLDRFSGTEQDVIINHHIFGLSKEKHRKMLGLSRAEYGDLLAKVKNKVKDVYKEA